MRRLNGHLGKGVVTGVLALLLLAVGVPAAVDRATGHSHADPGCQAVAFMSMTGVVPACR